MKKKTTKIQTTTELANAKLQPLIDYCQSKRGGMVKVIEIYNEGLETPVHRSVIDRWLNADPVKRTEPLFGAGLRLWFVITKLQDQGEIK